MICVGDERKVRVIMKAWVSEYEASKTSVEFCSTAADTDPLRQRESHVVVQGRQCLLLRSRSLDSVEHINLEICELDGDVFTRTEDDEVGDGSAPAVLLLQLGSNAKTRRGCCSSDAIWELEAQR